MKTNEDTAMLSATKMFDRDSSFYQHNHRPDNFGGESIAGPLLRYVTLRY